MKKGNVWHFWYKAHIGLDQDSDLVHSGEVARANTHDVTMIRNLLTGEKNTVYGDSVYLGAEKRDDVITRKHLWEKDQIQDQSAAITE